MRDYFKREIPEWVWPALLVLGGLAVFLPTLGHWFAYDDWWFIVNNPAMSQVWPWSRFFIDGTLSAAPGSGIAADVFRPLSTLSFAIQTQMTGLNPIPFRLVSVICHLTNTVLLWLFLRKRADSMGAFVGAAIFLVHPIQVESVVWISQRSILFCATACLASLVAWDRVERHPGWGWAALFFYGVALLSKETALGLPLILWVLKRKRILILFGLVAFSYLILRSKVVGGLQQVLQRSDSLMVSWGDGMVALTHYARSLIWPLHLNVSVQAPENLSWGLPQLWLGIMLLALILIGGVVFYKKNPLLFVACWIFLIFWAPHSGVVPLVTFAADRFMYLPLIGVVLFVSTFIYRVPKLVVAVTVAALMVITLQRGSDWKNDKTLWASSLKVDPTNAFAWTCYGEAYLRDENFAEAEAKFILALQNRPTVGVARSVLLRLIAMSAARKDWEAVASWEQKLLTVPK